MSAAVRVMPCLGLAADADRVVKGACFTELSDVGDPVELAVAYEQAGADELVFLDLSCSSEGRSGLLEVIRATAAVVSVPLTVRGGVRSISDVDAFLRAGADKVGLNTSAVERPQLIAEIARQFGSAVVTLCVDARRVPGTMSGFEVMTRGGRQPTGTDAVAWAVCGAELGAGEILLNSVDARGTGDGFDLDLIRAVRGVVDIPVIASGGAGELAHFPSAVDAGASGLLAASVFHIGEVSIGSVKRELEAAGHLVL
ncbi:MAG: imidazole glycerol phosphate synthase subunit HisF [Micromonosporaceae bacterium]|nr:imidazole glycerol phosphate synthase subunit HisF [Micromonosporaceae bacterium]